MCLQLLPKRIKIDDDDTFMFAWTWHSSYSNWIIIQLWIGVALITICKVRVWARVWPSWGERRVPQVNLHSAAAISGSTVFWAAPTTECCAAKVKSWYKPQKLTLNSNSAERLVNYLYLCYTDPLELPRKAFDSRHNRSKLFQTKHMGH